MLSVFQTTFFSPKSVIFKQFISITDGDIDEITFGFYIVIIILWI